MKCPLDNTWFFILDRFAVEMPSEDDVDESAIESLLNEINDLMKAVRKMDDIEKSLKTWVLELLSSIHEGICKYSIYGGRGLRRELFKILDTLHERYEELQKKSPSTWERIRSVLVKTKDVVVAAGEMKRLTFSIVKLIGIDGGEAHQD